ncbi:MAG: glucose-6-phosphate dehydrogenase [Myxococcales bacterium]|nr:glucose-6-phosphate dehydrogenase [Myxococcales bacterium]MCB9541599.1 glucose-6-phosphate dehydrogenase [Myxococcales bacterium]
MLTQIVIFGASGDLTARKLIPALSANARQGAFPGRVQVLGVARSPKSDAAWRDELQGWLDPEDRGAWPEFAPAVGYLSCDVLAPGGVTALRERLDALAAAADTRPDEARRLFYLALAPDLFAPVVDALAAEGLVQSPLGDPRRRVVVEKPFGRDLDSARALNAALRRHLHEEQIFRIDHYLGKETVQNILSFRFQNAIFEPLWNNRHVESIEISVCEKVGMEAGRGAYYDAAGALRDMVQNHLLQVLALIAMEPPNSMDPDAVRSEKVKVLDALSPMSPDRVARDVVRAQYAGYHTEKGVPPASETETYVAIRAAIHNWRWNGVPFLLRTGKRLEDRYTQVVLRFRTPPVDLLQGPLPDGTCPLRPNALTLLIQPREGIRLGFLVKQPGAGVVMRPAELGFDYADLGASTVPAYQRLLLDAIKGNPTLFIRGDETEAAWRFVDAIRAGWQHPEAPPPARYAPRSRGPDEADGLFRGCEGIWSGPEAHR